jgi:hypothetical protein
MVGTLDGKVDGSEDDDNVGPTVGATLGTALGATLGFKIDTSTKGLLDGSQEGSISELSVLQLHDASIPDRN